MPFRYVFVEGFKSAEPPVSDGTNLAAAFMIVPPEARVAVAFSGTAFSSSSRMFEGTAFVINAFMRAFLSASIFALKPSNFSFQAAAQAFLAATFSSQRARTSAGTTNDSSGLKPRFTFAAASSSFGSGAPCVASLPSMFGAPLPIFVLPMMTVGLPFVTRAISMAARICFTHCPSILMTFQP